MTCEEIISRAAYDIGDKNYQVISKDEWLKIMRRVYREFCEKTKILRNAIKFTTTTAKSYKLYGIDGGGAVFGDNVLGWYRAEYNSKKAFEVDIDTLKESQVTLDSTGRVADENSILYSVIYIQQYLWICFIHTPTTGDIFKLWYYELPHITALAALTDSPLTDIKYHDDLVLGLTASGWHYRYIDAIQDKAQTQLIGIYKSEYVENKGLWVKRMNEIHEEVMNLKDDTIPLVVVPGAPFDFTFEDTNDEIDNSLI